MLRFGTAGIRGPVSESVTPEAIMAVARAAVEPGDDIVLGRDGRETGAVLCDAAAAGFASGGASVERLGIVPTPALAFASQGRMGAMVTASHNPPGDNGIKLFDDGVSIDADREQRIEERSDMPPVNWERWGHVRSGSVLSPYRRAIESYLEQFGDVPRDLLIAVDCGCGTASLIAPDLLRNLGATVRTLNATIDGTFPARPSKPTPETIGTLRSFVRDGPADLGIAFDGDADRIVIVDGTGQVVHEDTIVAILAEQYVQDAPGDDPVVITTPNASERIDTRVHSAGGRIERTPLGRLEAGISAVEHGTVVFAAEPWKHLHPGFGGWIDGLLSAGLTAKVVAATDLEELRDPIRELPYLKTSVSCPDARKTRVLSKLENELAEAFPAATIDTAYGIRLSLDAGGWILIRPSGTEPKIRIYVESETAEQLCPRVQDLVSDIVSSE